MSRKRNSNCKVSSATAATCPAREAKPPVTSRQRIISAAPRPQAQACHSAARRPRVLVIVDAPNWAHDLKTANLQRCLSRDYDICRKYQNEVTADDLDSADLIMVYYWLQLGALGHVGAALDRNRRKLLLGVCSGFELENERREPGLKALRETPAAVFVNNLLQYRELRNALPQPVFYTPNGVDAAFYRPADSAEPRQAMRVGWAGSLTNHGDKRGYHEFILPAAQKVEGVELVTACREDHWRGPEEMREFYQSLDLYIFASREEGTPNPCLEAAACGVPLLTTPVGNMPELIQDGVNGLFIERDVEDISSKLILMRDSAGLRARMSAQMQDAIRDWDWRRMAENYRVMFQSVLRMTSAGAAAQPAFTSSAELYLASADRMESVQENVADLAASGAGAVDSYATVIGGLSGLNYLLAVVPAEITFFDINLSALDYCRMITDLISISDSHRDFISRVFGRSVFAFLCQTGEKDLTAGNQHTYLQMPVEDMIVSETLDLLSETAAQTYRAAICPHHSGATLDGPRNCRRLLPCWPANERVPVGGGQSEGHDERGRLAPNTNTFFYGQGWLESEASFLCVQLALANAKVSYVPFNLLTQDPRCLIRTTGNSVLHISNVDEWFPEAWAVAAKRWQEMVVAGQGRLRIVAGHSGLSATEADPHAYALAAVQPHVYGHAVEVTTKTPWGFHEFSPINVLLDDYLAGIHPADTTILHILIGEGRKREEFLEACRRALRNSRRVIVLEHNAASSDWTQQQAAGFVTQSELVELIRQAAGEIPAFLTRMHPCAGESDLRRNLVAVIDTLGPLAALPPDLAARLQEAAQAVERLDWPEALRLYESVLADAPQATDLHEPIQRLAALVHAPKDAPAEPSPAAESSDGISFCIITNGKRPDLLALTIASIRRQNVPASEIILCGRSDREYPGVQYVPEPDAADRGMLGVLRNRAVERCKYDRIVILDDDILLAPDWHEQLLARQEPFDILTSRILVPDGTRFWDHATFGGPAGHRMLRWDESDDFLYMSGGCAWVMTRRTAETVKWSEELGLRQDEDVQFSHRCRQAGFRIEHHPACVAWHVAPAYTRVGRSAFLRTGGRDHLWLMKAPQIGDPSELMLLALEHEAFGNTAELADCLRAGLEIYPDNQSFQRAWEMLQQKNGGDVGGDAWQLSGDPHLARWMKQLCPAQVPSNAECARNAM